MFRGRFKRSFELLNFTPDHLTLTRKFELLSPSALVDFRTGSGLRAYIELRVHTSCLPVVPQHLQSEMHLAQENLRDFDGIIDVGNDLSTEGLECCLAWRPQGRERCLWGCRVLCFGSHVDPPKILRGSPNIRR